MSASERWKAKKKGGIDKVNKVCKLRDTNNMGAY